MTEAQQEQARQRLRVRRRLAWDLLKQTRNPVYVHLNYPEFPAENLAAALEKIPDDSARPFVRSDSAKRVHATLKRAKDIIPKNLLRSREPGEDDE